MINLGCINDINPKTEELMNKYEKNLLSFFSSRSLIIRADVTKNPDAVKLSYPIAIELKVKVGLNRIKRKTK
jgi:hypothetical protein